MDCCLTALSHYLNQCWLIINNVQWQDKRCHGANTEAVNGQARCRPLSRWHWRAYTRSPPWMKGLIPATRTQIPYDKEVQEMVEALSGERLFQRAPGLYHPGFENFINKAHLRKPLSPAWNIGCPQLQALLGTRTALTGRPRGGGWHRHRRQGINIIMHPEPESASQTTPKQPGYYSHYNIKLTWILDISTEIYAAQLALNLASRACSWKSIEQCHTL